MNILIISRCMPYPLHLGDRLILYHLAEELSAQTHQIDLIGFYADMRDLADLPSYERNFRSVKLIPENRRTPIHYVRRLLAKDNKFFPASADHAWSPEMWKAVAEQIKSTAYDVVLLFGGIQVYEYRELLRKLPTVIVPYESYSLFIKRAFDLQWRQGNWHRVAALRAQLAITRRFERRMFVGYGRVVVLTDKDREALQKLNPDLPLAVIPNGIDTDYFKPSPVKDVDGADPTILFFGNFEYYPNADAALWLAKDVFPLIRIKYPQARLQLVGNAPTKRMRALAGKQIEVTNRVPDVRPYLEQASVFISPLRLGAGIKNKVLEAMAMGKPIVATSLSCDGIGLEEAKHVLMGDSAVELAAGVVRLVSDPVLRGRMGVANRERIEKHYTWKRVADQYETLFNDVIRKAR